MKKWIKVVGITFLILLSCIIVALISFWIFFAGVDAWESIVYAKWQIMRPYYQTRSLGNDNDYFFVGGVFNKYVYEDINFIRSWPASPCLRRTSLGQLCKFDTVRAYVDLPSFKVINYYYTKDKNKVYFLLTEIKDADSESFTFISDFYSKDKNSVYITGSKIEGADPKSFVYLSEYYAKDKNNVYYQGNRIEGADIDTFKKINKIYNGAIDKNHIYIKGVSVPIIDPETFYLFDAGSYPGHINVKDKNGVYFVGENYGIIMKSADLATYHWDLDSHDLRDKNFIFEDGKIIGKVNAAADYGSENIERFNLNFFRPLDIPSGKDVNYSKEFEWGAIIDNLFK